MTDVTTESMASTDKNGTKKSLKDSVEKEIPRAKVEDEITLLLQSEISNLKIENTRIKDEYEKKIANLKLENTRKENEAETEMVSLNKKLENLLLKIDNLQLK